LCARDEKPSFVIVVTAQDEHGVRLRALSAGADDAILKDATFRFDELVLRVGKRCSRDASRTGIACTTFAGTLRLDLIAQHARLADVDLGLTPIQFRVLVAFASHPDQVVAIPFLWVAGWHEAPFNRPSFDNVLLALRRKLGSRDAIARCGEGTYMLCTGAIRLPNTST
jgi:DNA-binding response OmpR family regulator